MTNLNIDQILRKSLITWDIKLEKRAAVYYMWNRSRQPKFDKKTGLPKQSFFIIDYENGEWYTTFVNEKGVIYRTIIDDITGSISQYQSA